MAFAGPAAPAEVGVTKVTEALQAIVARQITTESQALAQFGTEGAALLKSFQALSSGSQRSLGRVNYAELEKELAGKGISANQWMVQMTQVMNAAKADNRPFTMADLLNVTVSAAPKPRATQDNLAVLQRLAPKAIFDRYAYPSAQNRPFQSTVAQLLKAGEDGAKLCEDQAFCLKNNIQTVVEMERLGLHQRDLTVRFVGDDAFNGFKGEYKGKRLHSISQNLKLALAGATSPETIYPDAIRECVLYGNVTHN